MREEKKKTISIRIDHMPSIWPSTRPFFNSAVAGMLSGVITYPPSTAKVGLQLGQGSLSEVTTKILKNDSGIFSFYKGLSVYLLKVLTIHFTRELSEKKWKSEAIKLNDGKPLSRYQRLLYCTLSASLSGWVATPIELARVRIQADATLPASLRRNYKNVFHALHQIYANEGAFALWRGAFPQVAGQNVLWTTQMVVFLTCFNFLYDSKRLSPKAALTSTFVVSGAFAAVCSLPIDYVKTQIQTMQRNAEGKYPYTGSIDCAIKTFKSRGLSKFYTGVSMYCLNIAPQAMLVFVLCRYIEEMERSLKV